MAVLPAPEALSPDKALALRFPGFRIRPAQASDMRKMARIATQVFRDEHDASGFDKYGKLGAWASKKPTLRERLLGKEQDWRHIQLLMNRKRPGRRFLVATYMKQPLDYMTTDNTTAAKEKILGWAEFQEPTQAAHTPVPEPTDAHKKASLLGPTFDRLEGIFKNMTITFGPHTVVIPPNSELVHLPVVLESFNRARLDDTTEWKYWCKHFIPTFFGRNGDLKGRRLVLRSLVVNTEHWGHGIDRRLLEWGLARAATNRWDILTLVPSVLNPWTLDTLKQSGFKKARTLDIFWSSHTALLWKPAPGVKKQFADIGTDIGACPNDFDADASAPPAALVTSRNSKRMQLARGAPQQHQSSRFALSPPSSPPLVAGQLQASKVFTRENSQGPLLQAAQLPASNNGFTPTERNNQAAEPNPDPFAPPEPGSVYSLPSPLPYHQWMEQTGSDAIVNWFTVGGINSPSTESEPQVVPDSSSPLASKWWADRERKHRFSEPEPQPEQEQEEDSNRPTKRSRVASHRETKKPNPIAVANWYGAEKSNNPSSKPEPKQQVTRKSTWPPPVEWRPARRGKRRSPEPEAQLDPRQEEPRNRPAKRRRSSRIRNRLQGPTGSG